MIEEYATVVSVIDGRVLIESERSSACGQCQAKQSCGQKAISEWAASKMTQLEIDNPAKIPVETGDRVVVGIDEGSFLKVSALMYLLPLLLMVLLGGLAEYLEYAEVTIILTSFVGLLVGFSGVKLWSQRLDNRSGFNPVLLRIS